MRVQRNPTVKVDADQNPITPDADQRLINDADQRLINDADQRLINDADESLITVDADQSLLTSVAETTGRVAAKVTNVLSTLTGVVKRGRKG